MEDVLREVLEKLSRLPNAVGELGGIMGRFTASVSPLVAAIGNLMAAKSVSSAATTSPTTVLAAAVEKNTLAITRLTVLFERMFASAMSRAGGGMLALPPAGGGSGGGMLSLPGGSAGGGAGGAGAASSTLSLAGVAAVAAAALGVLVVAVNILQDGFRKLAGFVQLFNPGVITQFQYAMDNMGATIGRAFVPIFQNMTEVVRRFTSMLAPVMGTLLPVVERFSGIFSNVLVSVLTQYANVMRSMIPLISQTLERMTLFVEIILAAVNVSSLLTRALAIVTRIMYDFSPLGVIIKILVAALEIFNATMTVVTEAMNIFETVVNVLLEAINAFFGNLIPVTGFMERLGYAIQFVIRNMYVFAVLMAKFAGLDGVLNALIASVEDKTKAGDTAAQSPQLKSLDQLAKDLAVAAASAGGASGPNSVKNQQEFWTKTLAEMNEARRNGVSIQTIMLAILDAIKQGFGIGGGGTANAPPPAGGNVGNGGLPNAGAIAGGIAGGLPGFLIGGVFDRIRR